MIVSADGVAPDDRRILTVVALGAALPTRQVVRHPGELVRVVALLLPLGIGTHVARDVVAVDRNHPLGCARHPGSSSCRTGDGDDLFGGLAAQLVPFEGILKVEELDRLVVRRPAASFIRLPDEGDDGVVGRSPQSRRSSAPQDSPWPLKMLTSGTEPRCREQVRPGLIHELCNSVGVSVLAHHITDGIQRRGDVGADS